MSIKFSIKKKISLFHKPEFCLILSLVLAIFYIPFLCIGFTYAAGSSNGLPAGQFEEFAQNNILFYDPSECLSGNSTGICGNTSEEKIWSILRQTLDPLHAAAAFGSIAREGSFQPVKWEYERVVTLSTCSFLVSWDDLYNGAYDGKYGVGSFGLTSGLSDYLHYVNDKAPDLIQYFKDPSNTCYATGDELAEKIGQDAVDRLIDIEVNYFINEWIPKYKGQGIYDTFIGSTDLEEAAVYWAKRIEVCDQCGCESCSGSSELAPRAAAAQKYYDEYKDFTCSGETSGSCIKLKELRTAMWTKASQEDREDFMYTVSQENYSIAGVEGYMNQVLAYNDGNLNSWLNSQCPAFRGGISCRGDHTINDTEQDWINQALNGSNNIKYAVGNATGGSNVGAGKIVCVWDGSKCRDDVDYSKQGGTGVCSVYSPSADFGECWGLEMAESWVEDMSAQCGSNSSSSNSGNSNSSSSTSGSSSSATNPSDTEIQWDNGWLVEGSLEGVTIENMNDRANELNEVPSGIGTYETEDGKPNKILLHSTEEIGRDGIKIYPSGNVYPAHFVVNLKDKKVWQHFSIYQPSTAIAKHDKSGPIQFEIIGFSTPSSNGYQSEWDLDNFSDEDWDYLAKILLAVSRETGIPLTSSVSWGSDAKRMGAEEFLEYEGVLGHMHVPDNDHTDPGNIWQYVEDAIERQSGDCSTGEFVWYGQFVEPWASIKYTVDGVTSTVGDDGCGPTAFAMLANMLLGEEITPEDTIKIAADTHSIIPFAGSIGSVLTENLAEHYGLQWEKLDNSSIEASMNDITQHLKDGWMVMTAGAGSVPYTSGGHYVGIRGIDSNGKWLLADSGHTEDVSQQPWEPKDVMTAGINPDNVYAIKTSSSTPCRDNGNICKDSNSGAGTEATKPIGPIHDPSDDIACDPRTKDLGIRDDAYYNYEKYSIRLCSIPNIKMKGAQGDDGDDGYVHVNSRVSGAFYSLSEEHQKRCGNYLEAVDDYRTNAEQTGLYNAYLSGTGNLAAVPGSPFSNHQGGLAIDFDTSTYCSSDSSVASGPGGWFEPDFLSQFGLEDGRNFSQPENWHVQAAEQ